MGHHQGHPGHPGHPGSHMIHPGVHQPGHHHPGPHPGAPHHGAPHHPVPPHMMPGEHGQMIMPDIVQTHMCPKCQRIECSCEMGMQQVLILS